MLAKKLVDYIDKLKYPVITQPKLDGVRAVLTSEGFFSRNNKRILGMPKLEHSLLINNCAELRLDGELFCKGMNFQDIVASVKRTVNIAEDSKIAYHIFDCNVSGGFYRRYCKLTNDARLLSSNVRVKIVPCMRAMNVHELMKQYADYIEQGYEGIIVRYENSPYEEKRSKYLLKMKPTETIEVKAIGFVRGEGKYTSSLGAIQCITADGKEFNVGSGFDDAQRQYMWYNSNKLTGKKLTIKFQEFTKDGIPRFPIFVAFRDYE